MKLLKPLLVICLVLLAGVLVVAGVDGGGEASADEGPALVSDGDPPEIAVQKGVSPPEELAIEDLEEGDGLEATDGDELTVRYTSVNWNGKPFKSSWDGEKVEPFSFTLGVTPLEVSPGWEQGIVGMKQGGRRELIIPPELLYLPNRLPERELSPNETQVYVIDLVKVKAD